MVGGECVMSEVKIRKREIDVDTLDGGRERKIKKIGDKVIRPANAWSSDVHRFLEFLIRKGFDLVPKPYGFTEDSEEILSYVPGTAFNYPLPKIYMNDEMIIGAAKLLKRYHNISRDYINELRGDEKWMLLPVKPAEVMCHGDFAPYNVTLIDDTPMGIIDFDTLHPGPAIWDIAYAVYRWIPFTSPENPDHYDDLDEQIRKIKVFMDSYGANAGQRVDLPVIMIKRLTALIDYMTAEADNGNRDYAKNLEDGHVIIYINDINYIVNNERKIINGIKEA
jgi:hypothetical protein